MSYLLTESLADTVMVYLIIKKLSTPFEKWDAYKAGIIDKDGKKLKQPITFKERNAWTFFDRFIANLKKIMQKFVGKSKFAAIATAAVMLKDSISPIVGDVLISESQLAEDLTVAKQLQIHRVIQSLGDLPSLPSDVDEVQLEYYIERYSPLVEGIIGEDWNEL